MMLKSLLEVWPVLAAIAGAIGVALAWVGRLLWQAGKTLAKIDGKLDRHDELHTEHADRAEATDQRLRDVEQWRWKHSGETAAASHDTKMRGALR